MQKFLYLFIAIVTFSCNDATNKKESIQIGQNTPKVQDNLEQSMQRGAEIYTDFCMQCHLGNGMGVPKNFPPLAGSNWLKEKRTESIRAVKYGQNGEIQVNGVTYNGVMVPMGLSDQEVTDVMNYIMNSWGNKQDKMVTVGEVKAITK